MQPVRLLAIVATAGCALLFAPTTGYCVLAYNGGTYSQNFDSLQSTAGAYTWTNDTTIPGWYIKGAGQVGTQNSTRDVGVGPGYMDAGSYIANSGSSGTQSPYSFGNSSDRALGTIENNLSTPIFGDRIIALLFQNNTSNTFIRFTLKYDGEQWRYGGSTNAVTNALVFDYTVVAAGTVVLDGDNVTGYTSVTNLNFTSPISPGPTPGAGALDGNASANRVANITATISTGFTWQPGQWLALRWWSNNDAGVDHGLAIDNLTFVAAPEPNSLTLMLCGMFAVWVGRKR